MRYVKKQTPLDKALTILGLILCLVFGFLLICNLTIIVKGSLFPERPPSVLGVTPMAVLSGSMSGDREGHIEVGDLIFINKAQPEELEAGDVIAFLQGSMVVTHRIQEVQTADDGSRRWITKGDANNTADSSPVTEDQLVGRYGFRIPGLGRAALFMQEPGGMLLCIGVPVLGFVIYDVIRRQRYVNREREKLAALKAEMEQLRSLTGEEI